MTWETSFLAMSAALGVSIEDAARALEPIRGQEARDLCVSLRAKSKTQRAQALALALGAIARDISALDLAPDAGERA